MRIIQITDLHIGNEDEFPFGINVRGNFHRIIEKAKGMNPDVIVLSGDLCMHNGDAEIYQWIYDYLQEAGIPFRVIAGNHDRSEGLAKIFNLDSAIHNGELYYEEALGDYKILYLDTAIGTMSKAQLEWVSDHLVDNLLIFMHHPPLKAGVPHMDNLYPLENAADFRTIFSERKVPVPVFCGHYHVGKSLYTKTLHIHITPSCFFQIDERVEDFKVAHHQIALRTIDLEDDHIATSIHYYPGVSVS